MDFKFNPTLEEYGKDRTLLRLMWAMFWRTLVIYFGIAFAVGFLAALMGI